MVVVLKHFFLLIGVIPVLFIFTIPSVQAIKFAAQKETLEGIESIYVQINIDQPLKNFGVTEEKIKTEVMHKLQEIGIRVLPKMVRKISGSSMKGNLFVSYNLNELHQIPFFALHVELALLRPVYLHTNKKVPWLVTTWTGKHLAIINREKLQENTDRITRKLVGEFLNDYMTVNPVTFLPQTQDTYVYNSQGTVRHHKYTGRVEKLTNGEWQEIAPSIQ